MYFLVLTKTTESLVSNVMVASVFSFFFLQKLISAGSKCAYCATEVVGSRSKAIPAFAFITYLAEKSCSYSHVLSNTSN